MVVVLILAAVTKSIGDVCHPAHNQFRGAACFKSHSEVTLKEKIDLKKSHLMKALNCHYSQ